MANLNLPEHILALNPELAQAARRGPVRFGAYRSGLEQRAAETWVPLMLRPGWMYEPFSLKMPGFSYVPDFFGELRDGRGLAAVECKGWNRNIRADKLKFRAALEVHGWLTFIWLTWERRGGWDEQWYLGGEAKGQDEVTR